MVTGRYTIKGRYKDQDIGGQQRYTNLYVRQQGAWRLASQLLHPVMRRDVPEAAP